MAKKQLITLLGQFEAAAESDARGLTRADIAQGMRVQEGSVSVYLHWLKKHGAQFEVVKEGKRVVMWVLKNPGSVTIDGGRKTTSKPVKTVVKARKPSPVATKPIVAKKIEEKAVAFDRDLEIASIGDREFFDLRESLGLESYGNSFLD